MANSRDRSADLLGLTLLILAVFLSLSLISYDREDPIAELIFPLNRLYQADPITYPQSEQVANFCGQSGALAADLLLKGFGWSAYYIVISTFGVSIVLLRQRPMAAPLIRLVGWGVSVLGLTSLSSITLSRGWSGPVIGPGGYSGALGYGILAEHFGTVGSVLVSLGALLIGALLCTDHVLLRLAALTANAAVGKTPRRRPASDEESNDDEEDMPVRIAGKRVATSVSHGEEEGEDESDVEDEYEECDGDDEPLDEEEEEYEDEVEDETTPITAQKGLRGLIQRASPGRRLRKGQENDELQEVIEQLEEASRKEETREYDLPSIGLLQESEDFSFDQQEKEVRRKAKILEKTFEDFGFTVKVVEIETGPVIAQYEIELEAGLRLSKITGLADDLAIALRAPSVRIVAPIPGKNTVGIEVPNEQRQVVRLREVMEESVNRVTKMRIPLYLGKDVSGNPIVADLSTLPHLLIAGRTGTGKSVCLNAIISSILMTRRPDEVRMLMIDPKMVELSGYRTLPHLMHPVVTDMRKAEAILAWAVDKMEERYSLLAQAGVRHVTGFNQLGEEELMDRLQPEDDAARAAIPTHLPFIVIVADELADLMMTSGKEVEQHIIRLAQKSRAVGIHLILATQKPTVDVITGLIKSNLPARIAFQVASRTDSRVVLDEMGADKLLGNGDMLFLWPGTSTLLRGQGTYLSDDEINAIVESVSTGEQDFVNELVQLKVEDPTDANAPGELKKRDDLYESAVDIVIREGRGSVSLLQRCLGIGYGRAARLVDFMAEDGIVGPYNGSQAREVIVSTADWEAMQAGEAAAELEPVPRRSNRIVPAKIETSPTSEPVDDDSEIVDECGDDDDDDAESAGEEVDQFDGDEYEEVEYEYEEDSDGDESDEEDTEVEEEAEEEAEEYEYETDEYDEDDPDHEGEEYEADDPALTESPSRGDV